MTGASFRGSVGLALLALGTACSAHAQVPITARTTDGVTIHGEPYFGGLDSGAPLVLLFHQGGSNGRGEYAPIAHWLNDVGFRAIAWDQRRGGDRLGASNRTVEGSTLDEPSYCDVYPDLVAALQYVASRGLADRVVAWGSSYSGALVFRLAAEHPSLVGGVIAFSPASGGPMQGCEAREWINDIAVPMIALRPESEMELAGPVEQRSLLLEAGAEFHVVEDGVHGSSMLVDERTGADMSPARDLVLGWLLSLDLGRTAPSGRESVR